MRLKKLLSLDPGERVHGVFRQHEAAHAPAFFYAALFVVVPFFFLFKLLSYGNIGLGIFLVLVLTGLLMAARAFFFWHTNALVVTDKRVTKVTRHGWLKREVYEVLLREIGEIKCARSGLAAAIFRYGTIMIRPLGGEGMKAHALAKPEKIMRLIQELKAKVTPAAHIHHTAEEHGYALTDVR